MVKDNIIGQMETIIKGIFQMVFDMVKEFLKSQKIKQPIKVNIKTIKNVDTEKFKVASFNKPILEIFKTILNMDMDKCIKMEIVYLKVIGLMIKKLISQEHKLFMKSLKDNNQYLT